MINSRRFGVVVVVATLLSGARAGAEQPFSVLSDRHATPPIFPRAYVAAFPSIARSTATDSLFWTAVGVVGASVGAGIVLDRLAVGDLEEYRRAPSSELRERGETRALVSDISFVVAGVAAAVAVAVAVVACPFGARSVRSARSYGASVSVRAGAAVVSF